MTDCDTELRTSTSGDAADTVIASSRVPTDMSALTVAVNDAGRVTPVRFTCRKPVRGNDIVYSPGRRSWMRYWPLPSVTAVRTPSINEGLDASTVTPGSTAPDVSLTTPAIALCASAGAAYSAISTNR